MKYIQIPNNINLFFSKKTNLLLFKNQTLFRFLKLKVKIIINLKKKKIFITNNLIKKTSNNKKKKLNSFQGLILSQIKQIIIELSITYYQKLKFVGVGYRAVKINFVNNNNIFLLKLGLSHPLYLSTNKNINLFCLKFIKLYVFGNSYNKLSQISASIRSTKLPEPYKGKGILFENEKIKLKVGKKV